MRSSVFGVLALSLGAAATPPYCPLLGPDFPAPIGLADSTEFQQGISSFEALVTSATSAAGGPSNNTAYSVSISSAADNATLYELHYTPPNVRDSHTGVQSVDASSIYRIGSISKIFTIYTFLRAVGDRPFHDPITRYLPELRTAQPASNVVYDDINSVIWDEVTIGDLASQMSGIVRDIAEDISDIVSPADATLLGLPQLNASEIPTCGQDISQPPCTWQQALDLLHSARPAYPTSYSPAYSNIAFELVAKALGAITGKGDFGQMMQESIFDPLGLKQSSYSVPASPSSGVIPGGNLTETQWSWDLGVDGPGGNVFMSTANLAAAGRAILDSTLLAPALTRRWLKAHTFTADARSAVGAPWEIRRFPEANGKIHDLYTKEGDVGQYHTQLILSPDHQVVITIMTAGVEGSAILSELAGALVDTIIPAAEAAARADADRAYAGVYSDPSSNSSLRLSTDDASGLALTNFISRGVATLDVLAQAESAANASNLFAPRLYPSGLRTVVRINSTASGGYNATTPSAASTYLSRVGWRAAYLAPTPVPSGDLYTEPCSAWLDVAGPTWGKRALDDYVFDMRPDGRARALHVRGWQLLLQREDTI